MKVIIVTVPCCIDELANFAIDLMKKKCDLYLVMSGKKYILCRGIDSVDLKLGLENSDIEHENIAAILQYKKDSYTSFIPIPVYCNEYDECNDWVKFCLEIINES